MEKRGAFAERIDALGALLDQEAKRLAMTDGEVLAFAALVVAGRLHTCTRGRAQLIAKIRRFVDRYADKGPQDRKAADAFMALARMCGVEQ